MPSVNGLLDGLLDRILGGLLNQLIPIASLKDALPQLQTNPNAADWFNSLNAPLNISIRTVYVAHLGNDSYIVPADKVDDFSYGEVSYPEWLADVIPNDEFNKLISHVNNDDINVEDIRKNVKKYQNLDGSLDSDNMKNILAGNMTDVPIPDALNAEQFGDFDIDPEYFSQQIYNQEGNDMPLKDVLREAKELNGDRTLLDMINERFGNTPDTLPQSYADSSPDFSRSGGVRSGNVNGKGKGKGGLLSVLG